MTAREIKVLFVEDNDDDVELELSVLRGAGLTVEYRVVETADGLRAALAEPWDVVISDYRMPVLSGLDALRIVLDSGIDVPFILVSGTLGEEVAVEAVRAGANDYVLKDNLTRLPVAVEREIADAAQRRRGRLSRIGLAVLADAGAALAHSLDQQRIASTLVALIADRLADHARLELTAAEHGEPVVVEAGKDGPASHRATTHLEGADARLGTLEVVRSSPFDPVELEVVEELGRRAAVAIENARLYALAQDAVRLRDEFLAVASHELRTPLTTVQLQLDGLLDIAARDPALDERFGSRLRRARRASARLGHLVEVLLDLARQGDVPVDVRLGEVDLCELAREVVEAQTDEALRSGAALSLDAPEPVVGRWDRSRLEQVISNLVSNAIKYGPDQPIEVQVTRTATGARLSVVDHGIGVAAEDAARIFGRFERAASLRHYGGLGLGLYVARQIVDAHGGSVAVEPTPGGGATFVVDLPL